MDVKQKEASTSSDPTDKCSLLGDDIGKEFIGLWKSMPVGDEDPMDFSFGSVSKGGMKEAFDFGKLDMDLSLGEKFVKLGSFEEDMLQLDFSRPSNASRKPNEKHESSVDKNTETRDQFSFSFDFNKMDDFNVGSRTKKEEKKTPTTPIPASVESSSELKEVSSFSERTDEEGRQMGLSFPKGDRKNTSGGVPPSYGGPLKPDNPSVTDDVDKSPPAVRDNPPESMKVPLSLLISHPTGGIEPATRKLQLRAREAVRVEKKGDSEAGSRRQRLSALVSSSIRKSGHPPSVDDKAKWAAATSIAKPSKNGRSGVSKPGISSGPDEIENIQERADATENETADPVPHENQSPSLKRKIAEASLSLSLSHSLKHTRGPCQVQSSDATTCRLPSPAREDDTGNVKDPESLNVEKIEACVQELDDMCVMLRKKHDEAKDLLVRAVIHNSPLLMLNHPLYQHKLSLVQEFAAENLVL